MAYPDLTLFSPVHASHDRVMPYALVECPQGQNGNCLGHAGSLVRRDS